MCVCVCVCVCVRGGGGGWAGRKSGADLWEAQKRHLPSRSGTTKVTESAHGARDVVATMLTAALQETEAPQFTGGQTRPEAARVSGGGVSPFPG